MLSIEEIGRLRVPLVWTLHDQWPFCGAEHYTGPLASTEPIRDGHRYQIGYSPESRPTNELGPDINRRTWLRKYRSWKRPIYLVSPSTWLAKSAKQSELMKSWPIEIIANPLDLKAWSPVDKLLARELLGIPKDNLIVLYGANGGTSDPRKGADLLFEALVHISSSPQKSNLAQISLVIFGETEPTEPPDIGCRVYYMGSLEDNISLRLCYSAADVMVVPSRQEAFGQTASESQACGTPVVAFRTGGLPDVVSDRITGALADPFNPRSLAESITWVIEDSQRNERLRTASRDRAQQLWDSAQIARMYADAYKRAIALHEVSAGDSH